MFSELPSYSEIEAWVYFLQGERLPLIFAFSPLVLSLFKWAVRELGLLEDRKRTPAQIPPSSSMTFISWLTWCSVYRIQARSVRARDLGTTADLPNLQAALSVPPTFSLGPSPSLCTQTLCQSWLPMDGLMKVLKVCSFSSFSSCTRYRNLVLCWGFLFVCLFVFYKRGNIIAILKNRYWEFPSLLSG